jgi:intracellular sulfur oxidation DsrE/DsrF family protein
MVMGIKILLEKGISMAECKDTLSSMGVCLSELVETFEYLQTNIYSKL